MRPQTQGEHSPLLCPLKDFEKSRLNGGFGHKRNELLQTSAVSVFLG